LPVRCAARSPSAGNARQHDPRKYSHSIKRFTAPGSSICRTNGAGCVVHQPAFHSHVRFAAGLNRGANLGPYLGETAKRRLMHIRSCMWRENPANYSVDQQIVGSFSADNPACAATATIVQIVRIRNQRRVVHSAGSPIHNPHPLESGSRPLGIARTFSARAGGMEFLRGNLDAIGRSCRILKVP